MEDSYDIRNRITKNTSSLNLKELQNKLNIIISTNKKRSYDITEFVIIENKIISILPYIPTKSIYHSDQLTPQRTIELSINRKLFTKESIKKYNSDINKSLNKGLLINRELKELLTFSDETYKNFINKEIKSGTEFNILWEIENYRMLAIIEELNIKLND